MFAITPTSQNTRAEIYPVYSEYLSAVTVTAETFLSYPALGLNFLIFYESCDCKIC